MVATYLTQLRDLARDLLGSRLDTQGRERMPKTKRVLQMACGHTEEHVFEGRSAAASHLAVAVHIAQDELEPPELTLRLLRSTGDTITVQVVEGQTPLDPDELLYVGGRGAYEVARREDWGGRVLLALAAWPRR
jgi:hypothetical protein